MARTLEVVEEKSEISTPVIQNEIIPPPKPQPPVVPRSKRLPRWAIFTFAAILAGVLLSWWLHARHFESTDDAQIDGHPNAISARVSGTVLYINPKVENNQYVEAGTLLN